MAGGRKPLGRLITFRDFHTYVTDFLFFRTGIPTHRSVAEVTPSLDKAAEKFYNAVTSGKPLPWYARPSERLDNYMVRKFMLERNPDHVYDYVIEKWKEKSIF